MFTLNNISGVIVTNAVGGQCSVVVTPDVQTSANIVDKVYKYELQVVLGRRDRMHSMCGRARSERFVISDLIIKRKREMQYRQIATSLKRIA